MNFTIRKNTVICVDENDWPGVKRVADKVVGDLKLVFGSAEPLGTAGASFSVTDVSADRIYAGCIGKSAVIDCFEKAGIIDLSAVRGKREVYLFTVANVNGADTVIIAGSDKRGTIYGLFHISEILGVSPWVWFADVLPEEKEAVVITEAENIVSREPSIRYRGFFINDEFPSFGNWTNNLFGGFNAGVYDRVFELLLRMHGNYMWPAMWSSCFSDDGPGIENARLADEYGVVMGTSHHEPCMRQGEEFSHVKGPDSVYGNDWNFNRNREGLINFWRDGLNRNAPFENIITVGMRGEADSEMLGRECTTLDNINYLKDVITTQDDLIKEVYGDRASDVTKVFAVYKEVEKFYYGDEQNEGLRAWEGLDGTIILLSDDNHGNMRLLPPAFDRDHNGGFGMYYHLDYHGGPVSYEWVNSTYIPRIAEQMGQAYECGVRNLWIVNVGDIKPVEFPLNYFMDLAYDYEKWSGEYASYTSDWVSGQFAAESSESAARICGILEDYTRINSVRRPETISPDVYSPFYFDEACKMLAKAAKVSAAADEAFEGFKGGKNEDAFYQLVYFPAKASMNVLTMQIFSGFNKALAEAGCPSADYFADEIGKLIELDEKLCGDYNALGNGKWNGMMQSEHIGFVHWNEEEHRLPLRTYVTPCANDRVCVSVQGLPGYTMGGDWTRRELLMTDLLIPGKEGRIRIENCCRNDAEWKIESDADWIVFSAQSGSLKGAAAMGEVPEEDKNGAVVYVGVSADAALLAKAAEAAGSDNVTATVHVSSGRGNIFIKVAARNFAEEEKSAANYVPVLPEAISVPKGGVPLVCAIEAGAYTKLGTGNAGSFKVFAPYGKYDSALRATPTDFGREDYADLPFADYSVYLPEEGEYEIALSAAPGGPIFKDTFSAFGVSFNGGDIRKINMVGDNYRAGENGCGEWCGVVLVHEKKKSFTVNGKKGENSIRIYACDPGAVLMRIMVRSARGESPACHFGPTPSFIEK